MELNKIYFEDCIETIKRIPDGSIDLMLTDTPYNIIDCKWDYAIDLPVLWKEWLRIVKKNGAFVFTASQPFTTDLINSNRKYFKYEWIWEKTMGGGVANSSYMPLKYHENILVFYRKIPIYNPQREVRSKIGLDRLKNNGKIKEGIKTSKHNALKKNTGNYREYDIQTILPKSIQKFGSVPNCNGTKLHPTQKPVDLFRYLIKTYSNEGDTVFDGYMGSGTTAIACIEEKRNFIGSENNKEYFDLSEKRIKNYLMQQTINFK